MGISIANAKLIVAEPYLLERGPAESRRLNDQHEILLKAAGGYFPFPFTSELRPVCAILDVGTGNSQWLLGLRQSGLVNEDVELHGIDISDRMMPEVDEEVRFGLNLRVHDVCKTFPSHWSGKFDIIHARHVIIWIKPYKWLSALKNLRQALKPGGTMVIMYPGEIPYDALTDAPLATDSVPTILFSAFVRCADAQGYPRCATSGLQTVIQQAGFDASSIVLQTKKINLGGAEPDLALRPAASHHLDFVIQKTRENSQKTSLVDLGCPQYDDDDGWRELRNRWESAVTKGFYYNLHVIIARRAPEDSLTKACPSPGSDPSSDVSCDT